MIWSIANSQLQDSHKGTTGSPAISDFELRLLVRVSLLLIVKTANISQPHESLGLEGRNGISQSVRRQKVERIRRVSANISVTESLNRLSTNPRLAWDFIELQDGNVFVAVMA